MLVDVLVQLGIRIGEPQLSPQQVHISGFARQKSPTRLHPVHLHVTLEHIYRVLFRLQREGIHKEVPAYLIAEYLLYFNQIGDDNWTNLLALGKEEVNGDDLVLDQVVIETHL